MTNALTSAQREELQGKLEKERARILAVLQSAGPATPQADQVSEVEESAQRMSDRTHDLELDARERPLLAEVEAALRRLDQGSYGVSEQSGEPIPFRRLEAIPWARLAVDE